MHARLGWPSKSGAIPQRIKESIVAYQKKRRLDGKRGLSEALSY
jgi:hypothetical protein